MAQLFRLNNVNGIELAVTDLGGIITELHTPDRNGQSGDIVLGYDTAEAYYRDTSHMGAVAGRFAGRIAYGKCSVRDEQIKLSQNHSHHHLHGGQHGFNKKLWHSKAFTGKDSQGVSFHMTSPDGDEGYPGKLKVIVEYCLHNDNSLHITYRATTNKTTLINLTQHSYFNLSANAASSVNDHMLTIPAEQVLDCDTDMIPTGAFRDVKNTFLDFRRTRKLEGEYDHTFILAHRQVEKPQIAARLSHLPSGRTMEILTDQPALQLYTANGLTSEITGKGAVHYGPHQAVCLETQNFPDAPNHPNFPSAILEVGDIFISQTIFRFGCNH